MKYTSILPAVLPARLRLLTRCHPRGTALGPAGPWSPQPGLGLGLELGRSAAAAAAPRLPPPGLQGKKSPGKVPLPAELRGQRGGLGDGSPHAAGAGPAPPAPRRRGPRSGCAPPSPARRSRRRHLPRAAHVTLTAPPRAPPSASAPAALAAPPGGVAAPRAAGACALPLAAAGPGKRRPARSGSGCEGRRGTVPSRAEPCRAVPSRAGSEGCGPRSPGATGPSSGERPGHSRRAGPFRSGRLLGAAGAPSAGSGPAAPAARGLWAVPATLPGPLQCCPGGTSGQFVSPDTRFVVCLFVCFPQHLRPRVQAGWDPADNCCWKQAAGRETSLSSLLFSCRSMISFTLTYEYNLSEIPLSLSVQPPSNIHINAGLF